MPSRSGVTSGAQGVHSVNLTCTTSSAFNSLQQGIQSISYCSAIGNLPVWIIDSGATDHCSSVLDMFSTYRPIDHKYVRLPNGNNIVVEFSGEVHITDSIILTDLLYLPSFSFNLISVHKLAKESNCSFVFSWFSVHKWFY